MTATNKLLPCPFCGGRARIKHLYVGGEPSHSKAECSKCHVKTDYYLHEFGNRNVIKVWNRRAAHAIAATLGDEGVGRSNDGVAELEAENAKLREQVADACRQLGGAWVRCTELRDLVTDYFNAPCVECNPWDEGWQGCKHCDSGNCNLAVRALKLGVEVDNG